MANEASIAGGTAPEEILTMEPARTTEGGALARWLEELVRAGTLTPCRTLIPSAEMIEEAATLAGLGFDVAVADPSRDAMRAVREAARARGVRIDGITADFFRSRPPLYGPVNLIVDRTLFPTLEPIRRADWSYKMGLILPKGGRLAGWFPAGRAASARPPYPVAPEELRKALGRLFLVETLEPAGPATPGAVQPWRGMFRRK